MTYPDTILTAFSAAGDPIRRLPWFNAEWIRQGVSAPLACNGAREYLSGMPSVILRAHYDGEHIVLDEPFELPTNAPLAVTVLSPAALEQDRERAEWAALSVQSLARAYGDAEPEYTIADLKP